MDGLWIVETGLKCIVFLLALGFLLCFFLFQVEAWAEILRWKKARQLPEGMRADTCAILFFIISIVSGLVSVVLSGLVLMKWWI